VVIRRACRLARWAVLGTSVVVAGCTSLGWRSGFSGARVDESAIRENLETLASDEMNGRGSGTDDERRAAIYIASELRKTGLEPLGDANDFIQEVRTPKRAGGDATPVDAGRTWNVLGRIRGRSQPGDVILLSAHLDHLGAHGTGPDVIYNGADDDASGCAAVLALARMFSRSRPSRTVMFAFFGSEESGDYGVTRFAAAPPVPLSNIVAAIEFEMIGRPDPLVPGRAVWLTGFERSTLGPLLAKHGGRIVGDPRPQEDFFRRGDNYQLALRGVLAQTISTFSVYPEYHTPADDLAHIDFEHLVAVIRMVAKPVLWLADSRERPTWRSGLQPGRQAGPSAVR
jgi:hypothetical protein